MPVLTHSIDSPGPLWSACLAAGEAYTLDAVGAPRVVVA